MSTTTTDLSISALSELSGVTIDTLRYYERADLFVRPVRRDEAGRRRYGERDVIWVQFVTRLRATGMGIATIAEYTRLARLGESTNSARLALLEAHREHVVEKLRETQASLDAISYKIAEYQRKVADL